MSSQQAQQHGPPYAPKVASVGGRPSIGVDVPITSVFLFLFICGAVGHMTIFQINRRKGHKFVMSALTFGFCMARIVTMIMRIVWACYPQDVQIALAASIFVSAGVLILFIINLIFAQRVLRAAHPHFGWHKALSRVFLVLFTLIGVMLAIVITATVQSFYTLDMTIKNIDRKLQQTAGTYLMFIAFLPVPMVILGLIVPRKIRVEKFGTGRWRTKIAILLTSAILMSLGAAFRAGTNFKDPRPIQSPAWYQTKWCFYFFNFTLEIIVVYLFLALRIDRRFHVPNGSKGPGDYVKDGPATQGQNEKEDNRPASGWSDGTRILSEEEVFDDASPIETLTSKDEEKGFDRR
jgi:Protein of unknown function (DUF3112)